MTTSLRKTHSEMMMGNQNARKREPVMTNRERFLGALWNALNCSHSNDEILEVMETLNAERVAARMRDIYFKSKSKGTREQALADMRSFISFKS